MLMTGGCHGATGITVMDSRLMLIRPQVAVLASPGLPFSLHAAAACGRQPTSVSALGWYQAALPAPACQLSASTASAVGDAGGSSNYSRPGPRATWGYSRRPRIMVPLHPD